MAISLENLIDLPLLTYYDENIKKWVASQIDKTVSTTTFIKADELPAEGQEGQLYVTETSIKYWDGEKYVDVSNSQPAESSTWDKF